MLKKRFSRMREIIILIIFLLFFSNVVFAKKTVDANTIMNAFFEFSVFNRYSDIEIQDKLEKIRNFSASLTSNRLHNYF